MLTRRQQQIMDIIHKLYAQNGYLPTLDEIAHAGGINTRSTVHQHVQALIQQGYLAATTGKRAYRLPEPAAREDYLPLLGKIAAGQPIEALASQNEISADEMFRGQGRFVLKVSGESMRDIGIMDGDYVVIQKQNIASNGEIIVALVDKQEATLKRIFYLPNRKIELRPENSDMESLIYPAKSVQVQGKLVGVFRTY
ncbi:MAG: transcriptional repressor LexA [Thiotrichaceae bacterium]|jgi:repressor LexA|uniref:LexA repressor n=1 Tax=Candidatus Thiocaldithrix dubininis TaxID=3080823 RepID=A0AA95KIC7_9GAMM|nr:MAG: transcriptional repressor LexA [Candidatus Thiocaldithrix dubininis]